MKKILKLLLVGIVVLGLGGCVEKENTVETVGNKLETAGYQICIFQFLEDNQFETMISMDIKKTSKPSLSSYYDVEKRMKYYSFHKDDKVYYITDNEEILKLSHQELEPDFQSFLKELSISEEDLTNYFIMLGQRKRKSEEIKPIVDKYINFNKKLEFQENQQAPFDYQLILESDDGYHVSALFKDNELKKVIFYEKIDQLLVYQIGKVTDTAGKYTYTLFLGINDITHEEFLDYLTSVYKEELSKL